MAGRSCNKICTHESAFLLKKQWDYVFKDIYYATFLQGTHFLSSFKPLIRLDGSKTTANLLTGEFWFYTNYI